jgi:predicted membrane channel-forming protein YqfA (hemolysin III family)
MNKYLNDVNSNWGFVLVGAYVFAQNWFVGSAIILMGFASMWSHKFGDFERDWECMWFCFYAIIGDTFDVLPFSMLMFAITISFLDDELRKLPKDLGIPYHYIFLGLIYFIGFIGSFWIINWGQALLSGAMFLAGFITRQTKSIPNNHAFWHIIIAIGLLIRYIQ